MSRKTANTLTETLIMQGLRIFFTGAAAIPLPRPFGRGSSDNDGRPAGFGNRDTNGREREGLLPVVPPHPS